MAMDMVERYRRWFEYEKDAHRKVVRALEVVPESKRAEPGFQKAVEVFGHIVAARWFWLCRFGQVDRSKVDLFPENRTIESLSSKLEEMEAIWSGYLEGLDETELGREFEYTATEGGRFRSRIEDVLTQLFGHSLYHRGQIASLMRSVGAEPAATDFVFWSRERIPD